MNIRKRLVIWHSAILALLLLIFTLGLYLALQYHLNTEVDESLLSWSDHALESKEHDVPSLNDLRKFTNTMPKNHSDGMDSFAIVLEHGRSSEKSMKQSSNIEKIIRPYLSSKHDIRKNMIINGHLYRIYVIPKNNPIRRESYHLVLGRSLEHVNKTLSDLGFTLLIAWILAVIVCSFISWNFVGRTLRPINKMTRETLDIADSGELKQRIEDNGAPDEFGQLSRALNHMLSSLESSYNVQKKFLADASHELRTPLTSIKANIDFLNRAKDAPPEIRQDTMDDISTTVNRMARLVNELLMLARSEVDTAFKPEPIDLSMIAQEACRSLETAQKITVDKNLPQKAMISGDPVKIRELLDILLDNAAKYAPPLRPEISLSLMKDGSDWTITLSDNGPGIPENEIDKVFDRFYRASNTNQQITGSGLGLPIAKSIATKHGAEIMIKNRIPHGLLVQVKFKVS